MSPTYMFVTVFKVSPISKRTEPLTVEEFQKFLDPDGRLVDESALRKAVFLGGVDPKARSEVWQFLFGLYPCSSTSRERRVLLLDYILRYHEMKTRWKTLLQISAKPGESKLQSGLVARYELDENDSEQSLNSPDFPCEKPLTEQLNNSVHAEASHMFSSEPDFSALSKTWQRASLDNDELTQKIEFLKIQAQVYVNRHRIDINEMRAILRLVDKDVPRTDRDFHYFTGNNNPNLTILREILITYSTFHPDVGYAQGMNDILARFLVVFDSEVEAYWCFHNYLEKIQAEFTEEGMMKKLSEVRKLLLEMDVELLEHLEKQEMGDLLFCHRWLLLGFKREFEFMDSLRVFEILSSHHLELSSLEAEMARRRQQMKEFADIGGVTRTMPLDTDVEYTFELFMCVALLQQCRSSLMRCYDPAQVFHCINNLKINLDSILEKSEHLFFRYCKKTVEDSFLMVDTPPT